MNDDSKGFFRFLVLELLFGLLSLLGSLPLIGAPFRWLRRNPWYLVFGFVLFAFLMLSGTSASLKQDYENCVQRRDKKIVLRIVLRRRLCEKNYFVQRIFLNWEKPYVYLLLIGGTAIGLAICRRKTRQTPEGWDDNE